MFGLEVQKRWKGLYSATPPYVQEMTETDVRIAADAFERSIRALLVCESLKSIKYKPCKAFETSCSRMMTT